MFISLKPTRSKKDHTSTVQHSVIQGNTIIFNMKQCFFLGTNYPFLQSKCANYATYIHIQLSCYQNTFCLQYVL